MGLFYGLYGIIRIIERVPMESLQKNILNFWFKETEPKQWFETNAIFDQLIRDRFGKAYEDAAKGVYNDWQATAEGVLALCILLDQFPRNMFRGKPEAFASDDKALMIAKAAIEKGLDNPMSAQQKRFIYLPFEHSENMQDQKHSVELFETTKDVDPMGYEYAVKHLEVIEEFGRFPHRNKILKRSNTAAEEVYLAQPNAGF